MLPTVAPHTHLSNVSRTHAFRNAFIAQCRVSYFRAAAAKTAPSERVSPARVHQYEFFTPAQSVGSALIVDIDHSDAVLSIFETIPAEVRPSWVVETRRGAQAGWMIDPVDLRDTAREHPIRYARAVGHALRAALDGDQAVDPLTPSRVRNPAYEGAELRAAATPPVYTLGTLHQALKTAGLWETTPTVPATSAPTQAETGSRNIAVFDAARHVAYTGGDYEAAAWAAAERCTPALPAAEVRCIIRSISRYMARGHHRQAAASSMPQQMKTLLSEMGRRGGKVNSPAQQAARAQGTHAAATARKTATEAKARTAQRMRARGHTRAQIAAALKASHATVSRLIRRYVTIPSPRCITGASGDPATHGHPLPQRPVRLSQSLPRAAARSLTKTVALEKHTWATDSPGKLPLQRF